jgi:trigger factor
MAIDVSRLRVSVEEGERWRRTLSITVPRELIQAERRATLREFSAKLKLPGFRAGKIPANVVEKRFGRTLDQELLDRVIGDAYRGVLQERELRPISEGEVGKVEYQPESDLTFAVSFDVAPEVDLARLGGFKVPRPTTSVGEEEVDRVLSQVREREGTWTPLDEGMPATGDMVQVRIQRLDEEDSEPRSYEFRLGSGEAIGDVEGAIQTLEVGASGDFTITFPEGAREAAAEPTSRHLRIFLDGRKQLELPELNDELARSIGDFESLEALRSRIHEDLRKEADREAEESVRDALIDQILAANSFEVPESMVDRFIRAALGNPGDMPPETWERARQELRPGAVRGVKRHVVVSRVAESESLASTPEEVDARIEEIAQRGGTTPADVYSRLQRAGQIERLEREITEEKVFEFLKARSDVITSER